jgi:hypothetical protein
MYFPPLQNVLRTEPVSLKTWGVMLGLALTIFVAMEIHKWSWRLRGHGVLSPSTSRPKGGER